jgi:alpha-tubulin suppressor-like RCC1 family protein
MPYGDDGEILNSLNFRLSATTYAWGPFTLGIAAFPGGSYPVNQGTDTDPFWFFGTCSGGTNQWTAASVIASSSEGVPNLGIENSAALVPMASIEIYVKAQLFIVNTVTDTAAVTLTIPVTGLNVEDVGYGGGATIIVPYATWQPLRATGQQHKIVMKAYVAHFAYIKGCWSGGDHTARSYENTENTSELIPTGPGTQDWEKGWVDNVNSPVIATWSGTQVLQRISNSAYQSSAITLEAFLSAKLPDHPVNGIVDNSLSTGGFFDTPDTLTVNVIWYGLPMIKAEQYHSLGLKADGTAVAVGWNDWGEIDVSSWTNIIAISAGSEFSLGLKADGTVVAVGDNRNEACNVSGWTNIIAIAAGAYHSLGLKADGTVVASGLNDVSQCDVSSWTNIIAISSQNRHSLGLRSNGTVVAIGENADGECDVSGWSGITAISAGSYHSLGLKADGSVVAVGWNDWGEIDVSSWAGLVGISAGFFYSLGFKADGSVVAVGNNDYGQLNVGSWTGLLAISAGIYHTLGLKPDGTVLAVGYNNIGFNGSGNCDVSGWDLIP